jgi:hypothetical protein
MRQEAVEFFEFSLFACPRLRFLECVNALVGRCFPIHKQLGALTNPLAERERVVLESVPFPQSFRLDLVRE